MWFYTFMNRRDCNRFRDKMAVLGYATVVWTRGIRLRVSIVPKWDNV